LEQSAPELEHSVSKKFDSLVSKFYKDFMDNIDKATNLMIKKFKESQLKNPAWSQRAFAQKLGISSGALSEMMKGKRNISPKIKKKIAMVLQLSPTEQLDFFEETLPQALRPQKQDYYKLTTDQFHLISDWWHFAILNLIKTKGFKPNNRWIAERLGLTEKIVFEAWERLFRLGHLKRENGKVVRQFPRLETSDDLLDLSIRKAHVEDTHLIERSILDLGVTTRDHRSMTIVMNKKNIKKAKELIRLFEDQFSEQIEPQGKDLGEEVYRLAISFFPLTKISADNKEPS